MVKLFSLLSGLLIPKAYAIGGPGGGFGPTKNLGDMLKLDPAKGNSVGSTYTSISTFINLLLPLSFVIAGIILFLLLIGGGLSIIASGGNAKSVESGKNQITIAVLGFFTIFAAYWIVQIIEIVTGVKIFNPIL